MASSTLRQIGDVLYELGRQHRSDMRVPVRVVADEALVEAIERDHRSCWLGPTPPRTHHSRVHAMARAER